VQVHRQDSNSENLESRRDENKVSGQPLSGARGSVASDQGVREPRPMKLKGFLQIKTQFLNQIIYSYLCASVNHSWGLTQPALPDSENVGEIIVLITVTLSRTVAKIHGK
jgi:hypothetical protein